MLFRSRFQCSTLTGLIVLVGAFIILTPHTHMRTAAATKANAPVVRIGVVLDGPEQVQTQ
jgi:hypothetical protein